VAFRRPPGMFGRAMHRPLGTPSSPGIGRGRSRRISGSQAGYTPHRDKDGGSIGRRPLADRLLAPPEGYLCLSLRPDRIGLALGALGMDACRRIDGVLADRASSPTGIEQRRMAVVVPGIHRRVPAGEWAGGRLDRSDRTGGGSRRNEDSTGSPRRDKVMASLSTPTDPDEGFS
jgi:hypothetical protein